MDYDNIEDFVAEVIDDERSSFTFEESRELAISLHISTGKIIRKLKDFGLRYEGRPIEKTIHGFTFNPNNRWAGNPCSGGSGWEEIFGFGKDG